MTGDSPVGGSTAGDRLERAFGSGLREDLRLAAESAGCEILEADFRGGRLQIVLDHPEGTTLAHCEEVSKKVSALLDVSDFGDSRYVLEVSSPGLDRKLYGPRDYARFAGHLVRVTWRDPEKGKRTDVGRLSVPADESGESPDEPERIMVDTGTTLETGGRAKTLEIALNDVLEARLEIEI